MRITEEFTRMLKSTTDEVEIVGTFGTVKDAVSYLSDHEPPDLIFSDVQLPDGLSFEIFSQVAVKSPVIFVTAYDNFILNAFESNGIDYLLKPVDKRDIEKAILKYKTLRDHFTGPPSFFRQFFKKYRSRLLVRRGLESVALKTSEIALIYTENKLVYVQDREGRKYMSDRNLAELDRDLDPSVFFRVNRQYIINIGFVRSYKSFDKVKLQIDLVLPQLQHQIIVSQEMAPGFRRWINEL
jgi:two-component system LytT family response regulator